MTSVLSSIEEILSSRNDVVCINILVLSRILCISLRILPLQLIQDASVPCFILRHCLCRSSWLRNRHIQADDSLRLCSQIVARCIERSHFRLTSCRRNVCLAEHTSQQCCVILFNCIIQTVYRIRIVLILVCTFTEEHIAVSVRRDMT